MPGNVDFSTLPPDQLAKLLSMLPPEQLAQIPAGIPPVGTIPNLANPSTAGYNVITITGILTAIMLVCISLRFYVVLKIKRKMSPDDWAAIASTIGAAYYFIVVCLSVHYLKFGTHLWDLSLLHIKGPNVPKLSFLSNFPALLILPTIKTTFFLMYLQLFRPLIWLRNCAYAGLVVTWCFYISVGATQLSFTLPAPGQSWSEAFASPRYLKSITLCVPTSSFSLVLDTFILSLPIIAISHLQLNKMKKVGAAAMFSTGVICCVASSLAVYFQYRIWKNQNDYTYWVIFVLLAYSIEMCVGITTSCMPSLARLHQHRKQNGHNWMPFPSSIGSSVTKILRTSNSSARSKSENGFITSTGDQHSEKLPYVYINESNIESQMLNDHGLLRENSILRSNTITQSWSGP